MANGQLTTVLRQLRRLATASEVSQLSDAELLERFVRQRDEAAFELLVWRHGTMVFNLCRRLLLHPHDADDAFQATFLALVRKAGSIGKRAALASWLYKVAYRIALRARLHSLKRSRRECDGVHLLAAPAKAGGEAATWSDLRPVLDEELERLPDHYRVPVILCYLEGRTNSEAAELLGCPRGTIATRLSRARDLLRRRLTRRGVTLSGGTLALLLVEHAAEAALPSNLIVSTVQAGLCFAAGKTLAAGAISTNVIALTEGALHAMLFSKLKIAAAVVLTVGVLGTATGMVTYQAVAQTRDGTTPAALAQKLQGGGKPERGSSGAQEVEALKARLATVEAMLLSNEAEHKKIQAEREVLKAHLQAHILQAEKKPDARQLQRRIEELTNMLQAERDRMMANEKKARIMADEALLQAAQERERVEAERQAHERTLRQMRLLKEKFEAIFKELEEAQKTAPGVKLDGVIKGLQDAIRALPKDGLEVKEPMRKAPPLQKGLSWQERQLMLLQDARVLLEKASAAGSAGGSREAAITELAKTISTIMKEWLALTDKADRSADEAAAIASLRKNVARIQAARPKWETAATIYADDLRSGSAVSKNEKEIHRFQRDQALMEWADAVEAALKDSTQASDWERVREFIGTNLLETKDLVLTLEASSDPNQPGKLGQFLLKDGTTEYKFTEPAKLTELLRKLKEQQPLRESITIRADGRLGYMHLVWVLDRCKSAGFARPKLEQFGASSSRSQKQLDALLDETTVQVHQRQFKIPFRIDPGQEASIRELHLLMSSSRGDGWRSAGRARPQDGAFTFTAPDDGLYWFTVLIRDSQGKFREPTTFLKVDVKAGNHPAVERKSPSSARPLDLDLKMSGATLEERSELFSFWVGLLQ